MKLSRMAAILQTVYSFFKAVSIAVGKSLRLVMFINSQKAQPFQELHDLETLDPTPEWNQMYLDAIDEANQEIGLDIV